MRFGWRNSEVIQRKSLAAYVPRVITRNISVYVLITYRKLTEEMNNWHCPTCLSFLFPYNLITDENDFIRDFSGESHKSISYISEKLFMPFELIDKDHRTSWCDRDPDLHFYQEVNQATVKCNYYFGKKLWWNIRTKWKKDVLSLCYISEAPGKILEISKTIWIWSIMILLS